MPAVEQQVTNDTAAMGEATSTVAEELRAAAAGAAEAQALANVRAAAIDAYATASLPDEEHESWRKIRLSSRRFDPRSYRLPLVNPGSRASKIQNPAGDQAVQIHDFSSVLNGAAGPQCAQALADHFANLQSRIGAAMPAGGTTNQGVMTDREPLNVFQLQNLAGHANGTFVTTKAAVEKTQVVRIAHSASENSQEACVTRTVIFAAPNAELTVLEEFRGHEDAGETLWNTETYIICEDNARVNYVSSRHYESGAANFHRIESTQGRDARVHVSIAQHGGSFGKSFVTGRLTAPGGEFRGVGLAAGSGTEYLDMEMLAAHDADHTNSSLLYKTVVRDRSHSVFNGNLLIPPGRKHVDSHQTNNNILLNKKARAESMPKLIVKAEDVAAEHGATVGELDADAIFFLMARGLSEGQARVMLIEGFLMQVIGEFPIEDMHETLLGEWKAKLSL